MKASLYVLVSLLMAATAVYFGSYLLPVSYEVSRSVTVQAKAEQVYPLISNPTEWERWNAWNKSYDPSMIRLYGGPMAGKGASQEWHGDRVGTVRMQFTESTPPSLLNYKLYTKGTAHITNGVFSLEPVTEGTRIVWQQETTLDDSTLGRYKGFFKKLKTEQETEQSLLALKSLVENKSGSLTKN
ncbi:SRPBCC family protein [Pontibacter sp. JH31]|uniref:SRPBCC family protein n=1 Tax=Pontibacter aquaedesilientis TaxID=2766980 RepID=A0ABR7XCZ8_9BACT|nr:SRPBCC family protein [Pontibacter aquaedesilientis]MBD1396187.1 SRPBCC family protein [Pontibacter aquaedesilientis]